MHKRIAQLLFITLICNNASGKTQEQHARAKTIGQHLRSAALTAYRWRGTILTSIATTFAYHLYFTSTPANTVQAAQNTQDQSLITELLKNAPACPFSDCRAPVLHFHSSNSTAASGDQPQVISGSQHCFNPRHDCGRVIKYPTLLLVRPRTTSTP